VFSARHRGRSTLSAAAARSFRRAGSGTVAASRSRLYRRDIAAALALTCACALLAGCGGGGPSAAVHGGPAPSRFDGIAASGYGAPDFALHDQHGQLIRLSAERGRFVIVTFLYVHCTNVCPIIAGQLNQTLRDLPSAARSEVRVLAVSVDPKGDTPAAVARFIAAHRLLPQFLYLTGSASTLESIWAGYHIASTQARNGDVVGHTAISILLDRSGRPQAIYDATVTPQQVLHDLHVLGLQE
jgi:protein SCO1/2